MSAMNSGRARVTAVTVTYQSRRTLPAMLAAARRAHLEGVLECVFVDNGSTDGTVELLQQEASWARVKLLGENVGFGRGCNAGFAEVTTPYTILINPDAAVEPNVILGLAEFLDANPKVGIVGPAVIEGEREELGALQEAGERGTPMTIVKMVVPFVRAENKMRPIVPGSEAFRVGWVCGAVLMTRTDLVRQLGGFDPRFFLYWEETDLCRRADDSGFETWAVGSVVARHIGGASSVDDGTRVSGCIAEHFFQSRRYYMIKHHGWLQATAAELIEVVMLFLRAAVDALQGKGWSRMRPRLQVRLLSQPPKVRPVHRQPDTRDVAA